MKLLPKDARNSATHFRCIASKAHDRQLGVTLMKKRFLLIAFLFSFLLLSISGTAFAHHSWSGYDMTNLTAVKGTVTQFEWGNPHIWINFEVRNDKGTTENWSAGGPSPNRLANTGWDKNTLKLGIRLLSLAIATKTVVTA